MGDTDFYGRDGELESLQDAYDSRTAEMAIIYGHRRIGKTALWDEGTKNGPDRSALLGHNFVYQETKPHGFYSSYFHQRISS